MEDKPQRKNLPRHARVPESERPKMALTERDAEIIRLVESCRLLRGDHLASLFFSSRSTAQYRLQRLFQHEFLNRHFLASVSTAPAAAPAIYALGKRGVQVLVDRYGYDRSQIRLLKESSLGWQAVEHTLAINDVRIAIMRAVEAQGWSLLEWRDEGKFRASPDYTMVKDSRGKEQQKPVLPDGYFCLETPRGKTRFFLELDRGTEELSKVTPQIAVYEAYIRSGQYAERFQAKSLRILMVTRGARRLQSLKRLVKSAGGERRYWFTTVDQLTAETVLTGHIWEQIGDSTRRALVE